MTSLCDIGIALFPTHLCYHKQLGEQVTFSGSINATLRCTTILISKDGPIKNGLFSQLWLQSSIIKLTVLLYLDDRYLDIARHN